MHSLQKRGKSSVRQRFHTFARTCLERGYIVDETKPWPHDKKYALTTQELEQAFQKLNSDLMAEQLKRCLRTQRGGLWREFAGGSTRARIDITYQGHMIYLPPLNTWRTMYATGFPLEAITWSSSSSSSNIPPPLPPPPPPSSPPPPPLPPPQKRKTIQLAMDQIQSSIPCNDDAKYRFFYQVIREMGCPIPSENELNNEFKVWSDKRTKVYQTALHHDQAMQLFYLLPDDQWKDREIAILQKWVANQLGVYEIPDRDWWYIVFCARPTLHVKRSDSTKFCCDNPSCDQRLL